MGNLWTDVNLPSLAVKIILFSFLGLFLIVVRHFFWGCRDFEWRKTCESKTKLTGKTVLVTGGCSGIGKAAALNLARRGARVIIASRDRLKAEAAVTYIKCISGNSNVLYKSLDLANFLSVRRFAEEFLRDELRLDILLNNAAIGLCRPGETTADGHDPVFGINHFGHFLLTSLLIDRLKATGQGRVINVASKAHEFCSTFDATPSNKGKGMTTYPNLSGYACSKTANILYTRELARRLKDTDLTTCALNPGRVFTDIWSSTASKRTNLLILYYLFLPLLWFCLLSEDVGAQTTLHCALDDSVPKHSGDYFENCHVCKSTTIASDEGLAKKLWELSCEVTGASF